MHQIQRRLQPVLRLLCVAILAGVVAVWLTPAQLHAAPLAQPPTPQQPSTPPAPVAATGGAVQRATSVQGLLSPANYHYLGLEPTFRDGTIVLTIALEPSDDLDLRGAINFIVLTDDGLRRVLAGASPDDLDIAASAPLQFDPIGNKYQAVFQASGKGPYTVVVFNTGGKVGGYTLTALNGVLLDDANQVKVIAAAPAPLTPPTLEAATTPTETMAALVNSTKGSPLAAGAGRGAVTAGAPVVNAIRLSSTLDPELNRHFIALKPAVKDGRIDLEMVYEPRGRETDGYVNFYVVDENGLRQFVYGAELDQQQIATGIQKPFSPNQNELVATVTASGSDEYTVIPFSESPLTVTYVMRVEGGELIDRYGQTNEAVAAQAEYAALAGANAPTMTVTTTNALPLAAADTVTVAGELPAAAGNPKLQLTLPGNNSLVLVGTTSGSIAQPAASGLERAVQATQKVTHVDGTLPTAFSHNYWSLAPNERDGTIILTMDFAPREEQALREHINFWVVDEDGMRRIISGSRPEDVAFAGGAVVPFGPDKGKLQAAFQASGRGEYAVIVYNASEVPATYSIDANGGTLLAPPPDSAVLQQLP